jgi:group II intron reverse transcriptase/maturase
MIGTAFSLLIRLELSSPGVQFLQGDHQLFNGAPSNFIVRCDNDKVVISQGQPNPLILNESLSLKASILASLGQPGGNHSMIEKLFERITASYGSYGEVNESLQLSMLVVIPDTLNKLIISIIVWYHSLGPIFCVKILDLIWSNGQVAVSNPKERRHLREPIGGQCQNSGSPDRRKSGGDGGLVLARFNRGHKPRLSLVKGSRDISTKISLPAGFEKLGNLRELNTTDKTTVNTKILDLVSDINILIAAYSKLKSSPGNLTPGLDSETLDGIDKPLFEKLKKEIRTNSFQFRPARRIDIPKPNGKGTRPLAIASPRDKIVQGAMLLILEAIFEPSFVTHAHGFRPGKGCHTALKEIKGTFSSVNWFIEGDISKCFDTLDHKILVKLVSKRINDKGFIDLLYKALRAGYMFQGQYHSPKLGTPQGSIVSPLLCNILLQGLDEFVLDLRDNFQVGKRRKTNPLWRKLTRAGLIKEVHDRNIGSRIHADPSYKRLKYVRYADDFLIGIIGNKADCVEIREKIHHFLLSELKLNLNLEKTKITHARDDKAHFLGTDISITPLEKRPLRFVTRGSSNFRMRSNTKPLIMAPIKKLVLNLTEKGFAKHGGTPSRLARMIPFETNQIVKHFWQIWLGLSTYYSFADNYGSLGRIHYILKYSCVLTLASKLKLKTAKRVFAKFGKDILIKDKNGKKIASFPDVPLAKPNTFHITKFTDVNPLARLEKLAKSTFRSRAILDSTCTACGTAENIEMHHVRKLRDSSRAIKMDYMTRMMSRMNRKQIPICKSCHIKYHRGERVIFKNKEDSIQ